MDLRYPIGEFSPPSEIDATQLKIWIEEIERFPRALRRVVEGLNDEQLSSSYRPGGWTLCQVVHHLADSHLNSFIRFKWALTEDRPTIKAYFEERWADLGDSKPEHLPLFLDLLDALHARWVELLRSLTEADFDREFLHPESGAVNLRVNVGIYAWHGRHHLAHITSLSDRRDH